MARAGKPKKDAAPGPSSGLRYVALVPFKFSGRRYTPGENVQVSPDEADALLTDGLIAMED
jgi:hypothetical protein